MTDAPPRYDDGRIACDDEGVSIRWYYLWGRRRIPYARIRSIATYPLSAVRGKWRIWGSGDFVHWYNLDADRPRKTTGIEIDLGRRVKPCITPDDPDAVAGLISAHLPR
ncbi:MAG: PH domain-containing protein [Acidimicrobiales bacterium]